MMNTLPAFPSRTWRMPPRRLAPAASTLALVLAASLTSAAADPEPTSLDRYVKQPDESFTWSIAAQSKEEAGSTTHIALTSQTWRGIPWTHQLVAVRPAQPRHPDFALLFITGDRARARTLGLMKFLAERAGAMAAVLTRVPNQPLFDGRKEDALIAYTFDRYAKTGEEDWPLLLPMTKSAVRAMDTLDAFSRRTGGPGIERFVVSGASKRGWTTWLTAAVDPRVQAMAPMVIDMLNMKAQIDWSEKVYGKQSKQIHDYTDLRLHLRLEEPRMVALRSNVDPYHYRDRYTMPKLILLGTNDPYWTVDSLRHYWDQLPEPKLLFQTPNAGHDLGGGEQASEALAAFLELIADRQPLPEITWSFQPGQDGATQGWIRTDQPAQKIRLWTTQSNDRDFRDETWHSQDLPVQSGSSQAKATIEPPPTGYRAALFEVQLTTPRGHAYRLSSEAKVTPDTTP